MDAAGFDAMVAQQREQRKAERSSNLEAWIARHETNVRAVPLRPRLIILLSEARRHELTRVSHDDDSKHALLAERRVYVDRAYVNLVRDVNTRTASIPSSLPQERLFAIGVEAISAFSSMLPWSDSIVGIECQAPTPQAHLPAACSAFNAAPKRLPAAMLARGHPDKCALVRAGIRWTVPQRLSSDGRKLAIATNARRKRLEELRSCSSSAPNSLVAQSA